MSRFTFQKNKKRGFTIIELLVVITIVGIISSIVLVSVNTARAKARDARRIHDIQQMRKAIELYWDDHEVYPRPGDDNFLPSSYGATSLSGGEHHWNESEDGASLQELLAPYIKKLPVDPVNSGDIFDEGRYAYIYLASLTGAEYDLAAKFETDHPLRCEEQNYGIHIWAGWPWCSSWWIGTFYYPYIYSDRIPITPA